MFLPECQRSPRGELTLKCHSLSYFSSQRFDYPLNCAKKKKTQRENSNLAHEGLFPAIKKTNISQKRNGNYFTHLHMVYVKSDRNMISI